MSWSTPLCHGALPPARDCHSMVADDSIIYVFGGFDGVNPLADVCAFDTGASRACDAWCVLFVYTAMSTWSAVPVRGNPPSARYSHSATLIGGNVFVFGGFDGRQPLNDLFIFNVGMLPDSAPISV